MNVGKYYQDVLSGASNESTDLVDWQLTGESTGIGPNVPRDASNYDFYVGQGQSRASSSHQQCPGQGGSTQYQYPRSSKIL
jgi:hypothetical protein